MESVALGQAVSIDASGVVQTPKSPYVNIQEKMSDVRPGWRSVQEMMSSIRRNAPGVPDDAGYPRGSGLPPDAPNPNVVYLKDGAYIRYVIDTSEATERIVKGGRVIERVKLTPRMVCLSLDAARAASSVGNKADYWNGFTWIRNGYIPERDFPTMAKVAAMGTIGAELVFEQPVSASDEAVIRHQMQHIERTRPTLPIETADTIGGDVMAAQSVPFPEAESVVAADGEPPTGDFVSSEPTKRGPGRPRKDEG